MLVCWYAAAGIEAPIAVGWAPAVAGAEVVAEGEAAAGAGAGAGCAAAVEVAPDVQ